MSSSALTIVVGAALAQAAPPPVPAPPYNGLCEASAAVRLDGNRFAVASDEADKLKGRKDKVLIYRRGQATPVGDATIKDVKDLEAAAGAGDGRIYWITSHSLNKEGANKSKRRELVATAIAGETLAVKNRFTGLRARIASALGVGEWPLEASLNIEGMAVTPEGDLLLGLRAPLKGDKADEDAPAKAAIVKIPHAAGLTSGSPEAVTQAGAVWWLDLQGRGIRSLERFGTGAEAYLIVAGATREGDIGPALFWWDGKSDTVTPGPAWPGADGKPPSGFTPEAAIVWDDGAIEIFGDNEPDGKGGGCSDEDDESKRWFPALLIRP